MHVYIYIYIYAFISSCINTYIYTSIYLQMKSSFSSVLLDITLFQNTLSAIPENGFQVCRLCFGKEYIYIFMNSSSPKYYLWTLQWNLKPLQKMALNAFRKRALLNIYIHLCIHSHMSRCMYTYIYIHTYIYIYTHLYIDTYDLH